jgi:hypothetical protein
MLDFVLVLDLQELWQVFVKLSIELQTIVMRFAANGDDNANDESIIQIQQK